MPRLMNRFISMLVKRKCSWLTVLAVLFFAGVLWDFYQFYKWMLTATIGMWKAHFYVVIVLYLVSLALAMTAIWSPQRLAFLKPVRRRLGWGRWVVVIGIGVFISWFFVYAKWSEIFDGAFTRLLLYIICIIMMAWLASSGEQAFSWKGSLAALVLLCAAFVISINFQQVVDYPFGLYWSEGNRLWDYSIMYGRHLYEYPSDKVIPAYIDRGRQSLWGLPFLFVSQPSIWLVRFWSALVFTLPYALLGWFIFKPKKEHIGEWLLLGLWAILFLNQGPIYAPLVLAALLVAAGRRMKLLPAMLLVGLAGYYARTSRITWTFAPAMWAVVVTLVDTASPHALTAKKRWIRAVVLGLAGLSGFILLDLWPPIWALLHGTSAGPSIVSVEGIQTAGGRQPLLWDRLLPNSTYPPGIILGLLVATLPLVVMLLIYGRKGRWHLDLWQKLAVFGTLAVFLGVGIVVSVKIGGGSNLHNLDMFLLGLLFAAGLAWEYGGREWLLEDKDGLLWWLKLTAALSVIIPVGYGMMTVRPLHLPSKVITDEAISSLQQYVSAYEPYGDVLFIDHRQLLTFGNVKDVPLVPEYEKKRMMDEAMASNEAYFKPFYHDLEQQHFSVIISELTFIHWQGQDYEFGNENDAWVKWVSIPILCYYEIEKTYPEVGLQILLPRETPYVNPNVQCPSEKVE